MTKYFLPLVVVLLVFTACQTVVDADTLLDTEEKIFIEGYLSPQDTILRVHVSRVFPAIGTPLSINNDDLIDKFTINDAVVILLDEAGNQATLSYSPEHIAYLAPTSSLAILPNKNYFLKVTVDGNTYNASCHIPKKVAEINEQLTLKNISDEYKEVSIKLSFPDIIGQRNFYILGGIINTTYQDENQETQSFQDHLSFYNDMFQTDNLKDGVIIKATTTTSSFEADNEEEIKITLQVSNVEEIIFQHLKALDSNSEENPFAEYSIAPNNITETGAIGIFAGHQITEKEILVEL